MDGRTTILSCPHCRRRLRVPTDRGELVLTCPRCRTRWDYGPPRPDDVRFIEDEVLFIGDGVAAANPGPQPSGGVEREEMPARNENGVTADLWDDYLDGPRRRERPGTMILSCVKCQRLLRVPTDRGELILTCPCCRTRWDWSPPAVSGLQIGQDRGWWVLRLFQRRRACQADREQQAESKPV